jgi:hypothetical protein
MDIFKIKSQIKLPYFNVILKLLKSSKNGLKSDFVQCSIKSLNTLGNGYGVMYLVRGMAILPLLTHDRESRKRSLFSQ